MGLTLAYNHSAWQNCINPNLISQDEEVQLDMQQHSTIDSIILPKGNPRGGDVDVTLNELGISQYKERHLSEVSVGHRFLIIIPLAF